MLLGDDYLMSSSFTVAEIELARLGLGAVHGEGLEVVVGGLGLGYTARAALEDPRVGRLWVVEALDAVIDWHQTGLLPHAAELNDDVRCELVLVDFFERVADSLPLADEGLLDAILLDIDHTPEHVLHPSHAAFYSREGLQRVRDRLRPGGVFALWSDAPPSHEFLERLNQVFASAEGAPGDDPEPADRGGVVQLCLRRDHLISAADNATATARTWPRLRACRSGSCPASRIHRRLRRASTSSSCRVKALTSAAKSCGPARNRALTSACP